MIALRPGSARPAAPPDSVVMVCTTPSVVAALSLSDETPPRNVRLAGNLTFRRAASSYWSQTRPGGSMTTQIPATQFAGPAPTERLERAAAALTAHGFTVEVLD